MKNAILPVRMLDVFQEKTSLYNPETFLALVLFDFLALFFHRHQVEPIETTCQVNMMDNYSLLMGYWEIGMNYQNGIRSQQQTAR